MRRNDFAKILFEKRWAIIAWSLIIFVTVFGTMMMFDPVKQVFGTMMSNVPASMRVWFGNAQTWSVYANFVAQEGFGEMSLVLSAAAIAFGVILLASDESSGKLLAVLARPVRRLSLYFQRWFALVVIVLAVNVALLLAVILGGVVLGQPVPIDKFILCAFMSFLHCLALGTITFAIGAITGRKMVAGMTVGLYAFLAYMVQSLSLATSALNQIANFALYRYIDAHAIVASGLSGKNVLIMSLAIIIPLLIAAPIFCRRDLKTR
jgi:ABC-2 type transport system permease protein